MEASSAASTGVSPERRHASEQNFTSSQDRSHFLRQLKVRPQATQAFVGNAPFTGPPMR